MIYTPMTKKAINLIYEKHKNQFDKAGLPYVLHPIHVAEQMDDENSTLTALLHDIVEDTDVSFQDLIDYNFPEEVVDALSYLTHKEGVDYFEYIKNIGNNSLATKVKIADLIHNSDLSRLDTITDYDLKRVEKYKISLDYLYSIQNDNNKNKSL